MLFSSVYMFRSVYAVIPDMNRYFLKNMHVSLKNVVDLKKNKKNNIYWHVECQYHSNVCFGNNLVFAIVPLRISSNILHYLVLRGNASDSEREKKPSAAHSRVLCSANDDVRWWMSNHYSDVRNYKLLVSAWTSQWEMKFITLNYLKLK